LLVAALTRESKTATVQRWLREQSTTALALSDWTITEFSAALSLKLSATDHGRRPADVLAEFARWVEESFTLFSISSLQFRTAARFADQHALGLRAGDALHLAVCADQGATLCTLDRRLGKAGPSFGVKTTLL
jgi:predicted nucleic acid-binding protein